MTHQRSKQFRESPQSAEATATTRRLSNDELLTMAWEADSKALASQLKDEGITRLQLGR